MDSFGHWYLIDKQYSYSPRWIDDPSRCLLCRILTRDWVHSLISPQHAAETLYCTGPAFVTRWRSHFISHRGCRRPSIVRPDISFADMMWYLPAVTVITPLLFFMATSSQRRTQVQANGTNPHHVPPNIVTNVTDSKRSDQGVTEMVKYAAQLRLLVERMSPIFEVAAREVSRLDAVTPAIRCHDTVSPFYLIWLIAATNSQTVGRDKHEAIEYRRSSTW